MNTPEVWKPIPGYEQKYEVSDRGQVRSLIGPGGHVRLTPLVLKPDTTTGQRRVKLSNGTNAAYHSVHVAVGKLVLHAFVGERPPFTDLTYRDGDRMNDALENVYYGETPVDTHDGGIYRSRARGDRSGVAKLTANVVEAIRADFTTGNFTHAELAEKHDTSLASIGAVLSGRSWNYTKDGPALRTNKRARSGTTPLPWTIIPTTLRTDQDVVDIRGGANGEYRVADFVRKADADAIISLMNTAM